jgi:outer membrane protein OmpA-like peptidoglycan-associated protein
MSRMAQTVSVGALIALGVCVPTRSAEAQIPGHVRVVVKSARIMRWLGPQTDVVFVANQGTTFEVIDLDWDENWYWVVLPRDLHGSRKVGWIRASSVEPYVPPAAAPSEAQRDDAQAQARASSAESAAADDDKVTISVRRDDPAAHPAAAAGATKSYSFDDVHFDRDRSVLRGDDIERLRVVVAAIKDDPSLVVTIEGHTCSLGTASYNLALGNQRANAVKDYLVDAGVPADRLLTVSRGEAGPEYDNSHEDTRRLNRRVALVPKVQR